VREHVELTEAALCDQVSDESDGDYDDQMEEEEDEEEEEEEEEEVPINLSGISETPCRRLSSTMDNNIYWHSSDCGSRVVVLDIGSCTVKAGFASDRFPSVVARSCGITRGRDDDPTVSPVLLKLMWAGR
jgi:hypothetical protein